MPLYCTMVNACGQIGGYPIPSYRIPVAYVEHAEVPSALSARPKGVYSNAPHPMSAIGGVPAQPVDATLYPRWKDGVYSVISEESRLSVSSQAHLNKWCVSSTNGHVKPWELKPQQKDLMQVVRRPVERTR
jgi:hypothetical protein